MRYILIFFLNFIAITMLHAYEAPYNIQKFQDVLNKTKLQAPFSTYNPQWSTPYGKFNDFSNKYFYLQDKQYMAFEMCGKKRRSELREQKSWQVSTKVTKYLKADILLFPKTSKKEFTFLQIHSNPKIYKKTTGTKGLNKPLLRICWRKNYKNIKNHIWAIIRTSSSLNNNSYKKVDLGKQTNKLIQIFLTISNSHLKIYRDGILKEDINVSYWKKEWNYFKIGVYMQDDGCAKVLFKELNFQ